jgi:2-methylisocitrate lyase-like PEP mutase family enzyme
MWLMSAKAAAFRALLEAKDYFVAPGVFDLFSARIADGMGFRALYMTGYGTSLSLLGQPDAGIACYGDFVGRVERLCERTSLPLIADADTGFGGLVNVRETVRGYERAGAAAIQIEDQQFPKRCGHTPGKRIVSKRDMVARIKVAVEARRNADFCIIARTDARAVNGLDDAMRRAEAYARAGADVLFIEAPQSREELDLVASAFDVPVMANMNPGPTLTPELPAAALARMGFAFSIYPGLLMMSAAAAMRQALAHLGTHGSAIGLEMPLATLDDLHQISGFPEVWEMEREWADLESEPKRSTRAARPR